MVDAVLAVAALVAVTVPGVVFNAAWHARLPRTRASRAEEATRIVLAGVTSTWTVLLIVGVLRIWCRWPNEVIKAVTSTTPANLSPAAWLAATGLAAAPSIVALVAADGLARRSRRQRKGLTLWTAVFESGPADTKPHAWVDVGDGTLWGGRVLGFETDSADGAVPDLLLADAVRVPDGHDHPTPDEDRTYRLVAIPGDKVGVTAVSHIRAKVSGD